MLFSYSETSRGSSSHCTGDDSHTDHDVGGTIRLGEGRALVLIAAVATRYSAVCGRGWSGRSDEALRAGGYAITSGVLSGTLGNGGQYTAEFNDSASREIRFHNLFLGAPTTVATPLGTLGMDRTGGTKLASEVKLCEFTAAGETLTIRINLERKRYGNDKPDQF